VPIFLALLEVDIDAPDEDSAVDLAMTILENASAAWKGAGPKALAKVVSAELGAICEEEATD